MSEYRQQLPQLGQGLFLCYTGLEVNLIFKQGVDLPGFAAFPLLDSDDGRERITASCRQLIDITTKAGVGTILNTPTWMANRDRAEAVGYGPEAIERINRKAVDCIHVFRGSNAHPIVLSGNVGPRSDAYAPADQMNAKEAQTYHEEQIQIFSDTDADLVSCHTLAYTEEAIGMAEAARRSNMPIAISFTVETNGSLPTGESVADAIERVDEETSGQPAYYMINCAHPDHFSSVLESGATGSRLKGLVVNASRRSHKELNEATELDEGNPQELGRHLAELRAKFPHISVLGGCCGTDPRHLSEIAHRAGPGDKL